MFGYGYCSNNDTIRLQGIKSRDHSVRKNGFQASGVLAGYTEDTKIADTRGGGGVSLGGKIGGG